MKTITEVNNMKYLLDSTSDTIICIASGEIIEPKAFIKLQEKAAKRSKWELITESNPFPFEILHNEKTVLNIYNSYLIDGSLFKYETKIILNPVDNGENEIICIKWNEDKQQEHYQVFFEIDNSLLSIVNGFDDNIGDDIILEDKEDLLTKIVSHMWINHSIVGDNKPSFLSEDGKIILFNEKYENYNIKDLSHNLKSTKSSKRTKI